MQDGLTEDDPGQKAPIEEIIQRANQLRVCFGQFLQLKSLYSTGLYVIYKWGFERAQDPGRSGHIFFKIQLINLSSGDTVHRVWEVKDNHLLNDSKLNSIAPFAKFGYQFADWWQELSSKALLREENKSLDIAINSALQKVDVKLHDITVSDASLRVKFEKNQVKLDYKLWLESTDEDSKVYSLKAHVSFLRDLKTCEVIDVGTEHVNNTKSKILSVKDQEDAILRARTELISKPKSLLFEGDAVIDYYYLRAAEHIEKDVLKATFDLLVICQDGRLILASMHLSINTQKHTINILKAKQLIYNNKTLEYIMKKGNRLSSWQRFSFHETNFENPSIYNIIEVWKEKKKAGKNVVREIHKAETRLRREPKTLEILGFEFNLVVKVGMPMGAQITQEWKVFATIGEDPQYEFTSIKDIDFVDRARRTSEFTSFIRTTRVPRVSDILNSSLITIKELKDNPGRFQSSKLGSNSNNNSPKPSPKPSDDALVPKALNSSGFKIPLRDDSSPKKRSIRYLNQSLDIKDLKEAKKKSDDMFSSLLPKLEAPTPKVNDSATLDFENDHFRSAFNSIDVNSSVTLENRPFSSLMNKRPDSDYHKLRPNPRKGEIRPFSSTSPKITLQVFSTLISSQNLKKKKKSSKSRSPELINFPVFQGPQVRKRPKNRSSMEKKKLMLCEILEKQLIDYNKNKPKSKPHSLENSFS